MPVAHGRTRQLPKGLTSSSLNTVTYSIFRCQIRVDGPARSLALAISGAMHEHWRGFILWARHYEGLKLEKPCCMEAELDLSTHAAALGDEF